MFRPHPRIGLAGSGDVPELARLYEATWADCCDSVPEQILNEERASLDEISGWFGGGFEVYVARFSQGIVGAARCTFPTGTCLVDRIAVDPGHRHQGVAQALVEHILGRARRAGVTRAWLSSPRQLDTIVALGRHLGFREATSEDGSRQLGDRVLLEIGV